jgi:5-(carboxyamino)imidazole ribonucleotide synthase
MLGLAGHPLGISCLFLDPAPGAAAAAVGEQLVGAYDDPRLLAELARRCEVVTYEFEKVPVAAAERLAEALPVLPPVGALAAAQDRLAEKELLRRLGIPTADFTPVAGEAELIRALEERAGPAILKRRRFGYDGKGQAAIAGPDEAAAAWREVGRQAGAGPLLLERRISFERELSLVAVRGRTGETAFYPLVENRHREGILRLSMAPAIRVNEELQQRAEEYAVRLLDEFGYAGVLALELFVERGRLLANEIAPRVHNSGHGSIEGADTSQFENHLRAVTGLPLGSTSPRGWTAMVNLIGELPPAAELLAVPGAHLHLYGKAPRPGRKLGHVTVTAATPAERDDRLGGLAAMIPGLGEILSDRGEGE